MKFLSLYFILLVPVSTKAQALYFDKSYNSPLKVENGEGVIQEKDSGYLLACDAYDYSNSAKSSIYIVRTDKDGHEFLSKLSTDSYYSLEPKSLLSLNNGKYIIGGNAAYNGSDCPQFFLSEIDSLGDTIWVKKYKYLPTQFALFTSLFRTNDNGFLAIGDFEDTCNISTFVKAYAIKTDSLGNLQWSGFYSGGPHTFNKFFSAVQFSTKFLLAGFSNMNDGDHLDGYLVEIDSTGKLIWQKTLGSPGTDEYFETIINDSKDNFLLGGTKQEYLPFPFSYQYDWLLKIDSNGNEIFEKNYGDSLSFATFQKSSIASNGNVILIGGNQKYGSSYKSIITSISEDGNAQWFHTYRFPKDTLYNDYFYNFQQTSDGGYVVIGTCHPNTQDIWLLKTDQFGCDTANCEIATGNFSALVTDNHFSIFPNPANQEIRIQWNFPQPNFYGRISVYTAQGKEMFSKTINQSKNSITLDLNNYPSGVYLVQLKTSGASITKKLIRQ